MDHKKKLEENKNLIPKNFQLNIRLDIYLTIILIHLNYKSFYRLIKIFYGLTKIKKIHTIKFAFKIIMQ